MAEPEPRLYHDLADWYLLLTAPEDYAEEAEFYLRALTASFGAVPRTLLELGAGSGNNAWHYRRRVTSVTLSDISPHMLALSQALNPDCEHVLGDMRTLRLHQQFDAVFVHDAVSYMLTEDDLRQAITTAYVHCRPGGVALLAPDHVAELFPASGGTDHGGHDGDGRALRYLEWTTDPDPTDSTYLYELVYLLHEDGQPTRTVYDRHLCGLFSRHVWLQLLEEVGFNARLLPLDHSEVTPGTVECFVATRPAR
jgi:SAM-dependent methyltransferase